VAAGGITLVVRDAEGQAALRDAARELLGAIDGLGPWATDKVIVGACPYSWPWNVLGWPGVNVPAGLTESGLPLGATLLGPADSEGLLIALAAQLEQVERWQDRTPPFRAPPTGSPPAR